MKNNYCTLQNTLLKYLLLENVYVLEVELREPALITKTFKELQVHTCSNFVRYFPFLWADFSVRGEGYANKAGNSF